MSVFRCIVFASLWTLTGAGGAWAAETTSPRSSPFLPVGKATVEAAAAPSTYALLGVIASPQETVVNIGIAAEKRNLWVPVGQTVDGIQVVSLDGQATEVVIRAQGQTHTLTLKRAVIASARPASAPPPLPAGAVQPPPLPAGPARPLTQAEQEREARNLVSDLLEIGLQQRRAYEEAQRKAAQPPTETRAPSSSPARNP